MPPPPPPPAGTGKKADVRMASARESEAERSSAERSVPLAHPKKVCKRTCGAAEDMPRRIVVIIMGRARIIIFVEEHGTGCRANCHVDRQFSAMSR